MNDDKQSKSDSKSERMSFKDFTHALNAMAHDLATGDDSSSDGDSYGD